MGSTRRKPLANWIVEGDHEQLLATRGRTPTERVLLNEAWSCFAKGDLLYADRLLPENVATLGERQWTWAAEAALIRSLIAYACGDLDRARTFAGLAQSGLGAETRSFLLHPCLLLQASIALHQRDVDVVQAARQQVAAADGAHSPWGHAIEAIADLATGRYDRALEHAHLASMLAAERNVGLHLRPHVAGVVSAWVHRDRGDHDAAIKSIDSVVAALEQFPLLPLSLEATAIRVHHEIDRSRDALPESLAAITQWGNHPLASVAFQDLVDAREAQLRIRVNDLTRSRVLIDRLRPSPTRTFLEAYLDAEYRPSRSLSLSASGVHRWYSQQIEVEMIRARARHREPNEVAVHIWRALDHAGHSQVVRPLLDNPMAARHFSRPDLLEMLDRCSSHASDRARTHLQRVLQAHRTAALTGPDTHTLTARELEVLRAVVDAGDFVTVAKMMVLSRWTVRGHFYAACRKLGVSGREAAAARLRYIDRTTPPNCDDDQP